ncbi:GNAT family N-acetyltransferase [Massilia forsythiae]|uniref:GNAT family N-acetyltransferase n=1 Tax=Massilia forsythiae TaxID=2728020 RepID=A0A7Z2VYX5_9BURK|nr:GNAT family N-acetyltransferase [Massilia forsythiae]QJE01966.1 GNAT family N-acetyltransferase [Massilia forsythiae]
MLAAHADHVDPALLADWLRARSIARGLPQPAPLAGGGMRLDTGSDAELRRYVFPGPQPGIRALARSIGEPGVFIKVCGAGAELLALLPHGWRLQPQGWLMAHDGAWNMTPALPAGYRLDSAGDGVNTSARISAPDGALAPSGYAAEHGSVFILDRIATEAAYRRRGLGTALVAALGGRRRDGDARRVLVATGDGRALYESMGWRVLSPFTTAVIERA